MLSERDGDGFGAVAGADFLEDRIDDLLDAVFLKHELCGDFAVGAALDEEVEDFPLALRELGSWRIVLQDLPDFGGDDGFPACDVLERRDEIVVVDVLEQGTGGTGFQGS